MTPSIQSNPATLTELRLCCLIFLQGRSKSYLLGTRAYLLASRWPSVFAVKPTCGIMPVDVDSGKGDYYGHGKAFLKRAKDLGIVGSYASAMCTRGGSLTTLLLA